MLIEGADPQIPNQLKMIMTMNDVLSALIELSNADTRQEVETAMLAVRSAADLDFAAVEPLASSIVRRADEMFRLKRLAGSDDLTGIANRRVFRDALDRECARHQRFGSGVAIILLDLDELKVLNDKSGHAAGDMAIIATARVCEASVRAADLVARLGGDEFVVLLPQTDDVNARLVVERVRQRMEKTTICSTRLKASMGYAATSEGFSGADSLLRKADERLYAEKRAKLEAKTRHKHRENPPRKRLAPRVMPRHIP